MPTPEQVVDEVFGLPPGKMRTILVAVATSPTPVDTSSCAGAKASGGSLRTSLTGAGLKFGGIAAAPFTFGLSALAAPIFGVFTGFRGKHKQRVRIERVTLCQAGTEMNEAFRQVDAAFHGGEITKAQAIEILDNVLNGFYDATAPVYKPGNAAEYLRNEAKIGVEWRRRTYVEPAPPPSPTVAGQVGEVLKTPEAKTALTGLAVIAGIALLTR